MDKSQSIRFNSLNISPLSANFTKWSKTLKQFIGNLPTNCLSVFYHFVGLALEGLEATVLTVLKPALIKGIPSLILKFLRALSPFPDHCRTPISLKYMTISYTFLIFFNLLQSVGSRELLIIWGRYTQMLEVQYQKQMKPFLS